MRLGIVADAHLNPGDGRELSFHNPYRAAEAPGLYGASLERCVEGGAEAVALLGDLSHLGDEETLEWALSEAAGTGLPVWVVPGNHDASGRADAVEQAVRRLGSGNVSLATPVGEVVAEGLRVAGLSVESEDWGFTCRPCGPPHASSWGEDAVVLLSHYPVLSSERRLLRVGLRYAGDLEGLESVAGPLLGRSAPTVVLSGHLHARDSFAEGQVLQLGFAALVEPPFEAAIVDVEVEGGRVEVRRAAVPVAPAPEGVRLPTLFPVEEVWGFGAGGWVRRADGPRHRREAAV